MAKNHNDDDLFQIGPTYTFPPLQSPLSSMWSITGSVYGHPSRVRRWCWEASACVDCVLGTDCVQQMYVVGVLVALYWALVTGTQAEAMCPSMARLNIYKRDRHPIFPLLVWLLHPKLPCKGVLPSLQAAINWAFSQWEVNLYFVKTAEMSGFFVTAANRLLSIFTWCPS